MFLLIIDRTHKIIFMTSKTISWMIKYLMENKLFVVFRLSGQKAQQHFDGNGVSMKTFAQ